MKILVDADACPVVDTVENIAAKYGVKVVLICDTNHRLYSEYSEVKTVGAGADAVDIALFNMCAPGDVVVTQDYGVAAMVMGKKAFCIHQSGMLYTNGNIDGLLEKRHAAKKARMASSKNHIKGPRKRTAEDDDRFAKAFEKLLRRLCAAQQ